jgi:hypothetical protein
VPDPPRAIPPLEEKKKVQTLRLLLFTGLVLTLAGCGIANPWPAPKPSPVHRTVLMIGDSLMGENDAALPLVFALTGIDATVIDAHINGSGLIGPVGDQPTALDWVKEQVTAHPEADTVVLEWGGACGSGCDAATAGSVIFGSEEFLTLWAANAHAIIDYLHGMGKLVVWTVSPPMLPQAVDATGSEAVGITAQLLAWSDLLDFGPAADATTNWFTALSDQNHGYERDLWYDGALHQVRLDDGVHFTPDGAFRTAAWTANTLGQLFTDHPVSASAAGQSPFRALVEAGDPVSSAG